MDPASFNCFFAIISLFLLFSPNVARWMSDCGRFDPIPLEKRKKWLFRLSGLKRNDIMRQTQNYINGGTS